MTIEASYIAAKYAYAIAKSAYLDAADALESADARGRDAAANALRTASEAVRAAYIVVRAAHAEYIVGCARGRVCRSQTSCTPACDATVNSPSSVGENPNVRIS